MKLASPRKQKQYISIDADDEEPRKSPTRRSSSRVSFSEVAEEKKVEHVHDYPTPALRKVPTRSSKTVGKGKGVTDNNYGKGSDSSDRKSLLRRLTHPFERKSSSKGSIDQESSENEDPVMTIFASRNTQRVRFSLEGAESDSKRNKKSQELASNVKQFMSRALFGGSTKSSKKLKEEMEREVAAELGSSLIWESAETSTGPEVVHTQSDNTDTGLTIAFTEDPKIRAKHAKLLRKAERAEDVQFRYEYALKLYVKALNLLETSNYPKNHPTVVQTVELLNNAHHVLSSYNNSANIVKIGIKHEDSGELIRALKMYTIAYRIRRDNLSRDHPSHVVLLNMLGSIQIKRGELKEAILIYELALKDASEGENRGNLLAKSVTYREMGIINEKWGNDEEALTLFNKSLECVAEWKEVALHEKGFPTLRKVASNHSIDYSITNVHFKQSSSDHFNEGESEKGEMELFLGCGKETRLGVPSNGNIYDSFFPLTLEEEMERASMASKNNESDSKLSKDSYADMDIALTLHHVAQLHRRQGKFALALDAFQVALRGMKFSLGRHHPNVAAVLGNIGNLQKEMGDLDAAYNTYQEVLGIESYILGLGHADVAITLHNIATIDAARGNYQQALELYLKVIGLQKRLFGVRDVSVAITAACMGDVYEKLGEFSTAIQYFDESLRIKMASQGKHSLDVARILHKLSKLNFLRNDYHTANSHISRTIFIYRLNKVDEDHEWMVEANRDTADIVAALALGTGRQFEC